MTTDLNPLVPSTMEVVLMLGAFCLLGAILILVVVRVALRRSAPDGSDRRASPGSDSADADAESPEAGARQR
jgi:hypothetical protein